MADKSLPVHSRQFRMAHVCFVLFRRHSCPACGGRLHLGIHTRVIQPGDADAHRVDWDAADVPVRGAVRLQEVVLRCTNCGACHSVQSMWARRGTKK